jgi:hypothetical protein
MSVYARASKRSHTGGKCVSCCGLPFFNIAEVGITGPKWRKIITAVIRKNAQYIERTQKKKKKRHNFHDTYTLN